MDNSNDKSSDNKVLFALRAQQKDKFATILNRVNDVPRIKQIKTKLGIDRYDFEQISPKYKQQILDGASYAYSALTQTPTAVIFNYNVLDRYLTFEPKLDHLLKTGLCLLAIDNTTHLVAAMYALMDICDRKYKNNNKHLYSINIRHRMEVSNQFMNAYCNKYKDFGNIYLRNSPNDYGIYEESTFAWCRPELRKTGLFFCMYNVYMPFLKCQLGYKHSFGRANNPRSLLLSDQSYNKYNKLSIKFADFKLSNGKTVKEHYIDKLTLYGITKSDIRTKWNSIAINGFVYDLTNDSKQKTEQELINKSWVVVNRYLQNRRLSKL